jgi:hypothetical protein
VTKILLYTFYNPWKIGFKVVNSINLPQVKKLFIVGKKGTNRIIALLTKNEYDYVLGIGNYRKNAKKIRIESKFINKYGTKEIFPGKPSFYEATWNVEPTASCQIANNGSNGPCNYSAYVIADFLKTNKLPTKTAFVHIPTSFTPTDIELIVKSWLTSV